MIARTLATAALLALGTPAFAQLQITIDITADTITVTGNDTVTLAPEFVFGPPTGAFEGTVIWVFGVETGPGELRVINAVNSAIRSAFVGFNGTDPTAGGGEEPRFTIDAPDDFSLVMFIRDTDSELAEFGGTGVPVSYAGLLTPTTEDYLESLDGQVMLPGVTSTASGHSRISIRVIPEPATLALLGLGGLACLTRRRPA